MDNIYEYNKEKLFRDASFTGARIIADQGPLRGEIIKIITDTTHHWQPYGPKDGVFVIETDEPFFWRINPRWAEEVANEIIKLIENNDKGR